MPDQRIIEQVVGILAMQEITYKTVDDKNTLLVPFGSTGVFINFRDWGDQTVISLRAYVLEQVDTSPERRQKILEALNEKNRALSFAKFYFVDDGTVVVEHDLLGDYLQQYELRNALAVVAGMADDADDELSAAIGSGVRAADLWKQAESEAQPAAGTGPVVSA